MSLLLRRRTGEMLCFRVMIIIYLPIINQISSTHCVYGFCVVNFLDFLFSVYCSRSALWASICSSLLTFTLLLYYWWRYPLSFTWKRNNDSFFFPQVLFLFVCFNSQDLPHSLICVSLIIQRYKLLTSCLPHQAACDFSWPWRIDTSCYEQACKVKIWILWCEDPNQINWQTFCNQSSLEQDLFLIQIMHWNVNC